MLAQLEFDSVCKCIDEGEHKLLTVLADIFEDAEDDRAPSVRYIILCGLQPLYMPLMKVYSWERWNKPPLSTPHNLLLDDLYLDMIKFLGVGGLNTTGITNGRYGARRCVDAKTDIILFYQASKAYLSLVEVMKGILGGRK